MADEKGGKSGFVPETIGIYNPADLEPLNPLAPGTGVEITPQEHIDNNGTTVVNLQPTERLHCPLNQM